MGILSSFNIGITGLKGIGSSMAITADNIANAETNGYKSSRPEFQDILARSLKGIEGGDQIGAGTILAHVKPIFTQGGMVRTEQVTDLAINGDGFFSVEAPFGKGYTRDGSFHFDKEGFLINSDGYKVEGYLANRQGKLTNQLGGIKLGSTTIPATATNNVKVSMNLDSRAEIKQFNILKPEETSQYNTGVVVYDNVGTPRLSTIYFNKIAENRWEYHATARGEDSAEGVSGGPDVEMANGVIEFNNKGVLNQEVEGLNSFNFNKGAGQDQKIKFDFGESLTEGGNGLDASTQYGSMTSVTRHTQDGSSAGMISSLAFNDQGILAAVYDNGEVRDLAQIAVAKFENNEGLFKLGKNLYKSTRKSGQPVMGRSHENGRGEVLSKSLEESNVDIADEFVRLMRAQRDFSANTRTITTADQMLQDVLSIKR
jgi:flagellar hook protein FlgE